MKETIIPGPNGDLCVQWDTGVVYLGYLSTTAPEWHEPAIEIDKASGKLGEPSQLDQLIKALEAAR